MSRAASSGRMQTRWSAVILKQGVAPLALFAAVLGVWESLVRLLGVPSFILPSPSLIGITLVKDAHILLPSLRTTLQITAAGFVLAMAGGIVLGILFNQSKMAERIFYPYAVILQVTPVIAVAPLLLIYLPQSAAVLACAWIVAFFPVLTNTTLGLNSADRNLVELFRLYRASRWQQLVHLKLPSALPSILAGMRIAGGRCYFSGSVRPVASDIAQLAGRCAQRQLNATYATSSDRRSGARECSLFRWTSAASRRMKLARSAGLSEARNLS